MKNSELRALSMEELDQKLVAEKDAMQKLRFAHAISPIENPIKIKETRRLIARIETVIQQKEVEK